LSDSLYSLLMSTLNEAGQHVVVAADELAKVITPLLDLDWESKTPDLDWTQSQTAIHTMRACLEYSSQVVGKKMDSYQPVLIDKKEIAKPSDYPLMIQTAARNLQKVVAMADINDRAWHTAGVSDPIGFAAMGVVEVSVHTYDLALGFGVEFTPLDLPCEFAIKRLFADTVDISNPDFYKKSYGEQMLWYAGRISLADQKRREGWRWNGLVR